MGAKVTSLLAEVTDLATHEGIRLVCAATGLRPAGLLGDPFLSSDAVARFRDLVERRRSGEPLQYIEGTVQFGPIELVADPRALIPRPETERLWEIAASLVGDAVAPVVVDLCTGSGNLALAHKYALPEAVVFGVDVSPTAIDLAQENAARLGLRVQFLIGDLFAPLPHHLQGAVDLLVSNPPYVAAGEPLPAEVADHEPSLALISGPTGTEVLARIAAGAPDWLRPGGYIVCEIGETQGGECLRLFAGFDPRIEPDFAGRPRFVIGRAPQLSIVH
jgi:release factor glutamine methyltransferase